jgi:hypothetical protein
VFNSLVTAFAQQDKGGLYGYRAALTGMPAGLTF